MGKEKKQNLIIAKDKKGMTLIEVIVGLAVCAIFLGICIAVISPILNVDARNESKTEAQMIAKNLTESIRGKTDTCNTLSSADGGKSIAYDDNIITVNSDGYLTIKGNLVYPASYYNNNDDKSSSSKTISMTTSDAGTNKVEMVLEVKRGDMVLAKVDTLLSPVLTGYSESSTSDDTYPGTDIKLVSNYWPTDEDYDKLSDKKWGTISIPAGGIFKYTDGNYYVVVKDIDLNRSQASSGPGGTAYNWFYTDKITGRIITDWTDGLQKDDMTRGDMCKVANDYYVYIDGGVYAYAPMTKHPQQWYKLPN